VFTNQGKRDAELAILNAKSPASRTEAEKERHTRLTAGTLMTRAEVKDLTDVIPNLAFIMALARTVREREGEGPGEARKSFRVTEGGSCDRTGRFTLGVNLEVGS
jgi:hypothetical protein